MLLFTDIPYPEISGNGDILSDMSDIGDDNSDDSQDYSSLRPPPIKAYTIHYHQGGGLKR